MAGFEKDLNYGQFVTKEGNVSPKKNINLKTINFSSSDSDIKLAGSVISRNFISDRARRKKQHDIEKKRKKRVATINKNIKKSKKLAARMERFNAGLKRKQDKVKRQNAALEQKERLKKINSSLGKNRSSIGVKLICIISTLVIISLGLITFLVSMFVSGDTRISAEDNNLTINSRTATDTEHRLNTAFSNVGMFLDLLRNSQSNEEIASNAAMFFKRNQDIAAIILPDDFRTYANKSFFIKNELDEKLLDDYICFESDSVEKAYQGNYVLKNASPVFNVPAIAMFSPLSAFAENRCIVVIYSSAALSESFGTGSINLSFFVNNAGEILIHPDMSLMMESVDYSDNFIVQKMKESLSNNGQLTFTQNDGEEDAEYIGAFHKLTNGSGAIITVVKTSVILEAVNATTRRNIYLTVAILSLAILIIYVFSKSLSTPLKTLTAVANEINKANFNTELFEELNTNRKDEIGVLIQSTKKEREILNTFTKLTNKGVTDAIVLKKIDFEPHLKDITIFFSDIRGFTAISDGFKNRFGEESAAEIIGFLNDYMSRMVTCITNTGGVVDKFEGDAIMACWGVLRNDDLDCELSLEDHIGKIQRKNNCILSDEEKAALVAKREDFEQNHAQHIMDDAISAITASIAMRYSLMKYNKDAEAFTKAHEGEPLAKYKPHIRIGAGINTGRATVGFMGSYDKMEFTSIGDAVNFASRTEASNKPCGTDLLITEDTYNLLKTRYIRCEENSFEISPVDMPYEIIAEQIPVEFEVKGKGAQHFYAVVNLPNFDIEAFFKKADPDFKIDEDCRKAVGPDGPKNIHEVRAMLGIPEPDFEGVNLDEEENKIQVKTQNSGS
ncbi:adenylate/guanylate cyclase domain-containing protein [Treponema sp. C6A8]|uniref:adenylate/guanylate cyclase domain-containing protein n=1 Tax=Treponema sp. C6A8 TaxID=1410609 RepID=UPI0004825540|nr:adenylate/guanylate cyclase domain-containing protein [Treponema sp. C6A8]